MNVVINKPATCRAYPSTVCRPASYQDALVGRSWRLRCYHHNGTPRLAAESTVPSSIRDQAETALFWTRHRHNQYKSLPLGMHTIDIHRSHLRWEQSFTAAQSQLTAVWTWNFCCSRLGRTHTEQFQRLLLMLDDLFFIPCTQARPFMLKLNLLRQLTTVWPRKFCWLLIRLMVLDRLWRIIRDRFWSWMITKNYMTNSCKSSSIICTGD